MWSRRCMHEKSLYSHNCFLTLTYDDSHLPQGGFLRSRDLVLFIKRLRKFGENDSIAILRDPVVRSIRYFACGEYGKRSLRPHYHLLLFNCNFADRYKVGKEYYESPTVARLWSDPKSKVSYGTHKIGDVTAASAAYCAKYCVKPGDVPEWVCRETGEVRPLPFVRMSSNPGIGKRWLEQFHDELQSGFLVVDGQRVQIPLYYKRKLPPATWVKMKLSMMAFDYEEKSDRELNDAFVVSQSRRSLYDNPTF